MKRLLAALGLAGDASEDDALVAVNSLIADRKAIAVAAGLAADAATDIIVSAMKAGSGDADPSKFVPIAVVTAMQADLKALQDQVGQDKAEEAVGAAIRDGRLAPAMKDWALAYHRKDAAGFADFIAKSPVLTAAQRATATPPEKKKDGQLDAHHSAIASAMGVDPEAYAKVLAAEAEGEDD